MSEKDNASHPTLTGRSGRPILLSIYPCWTKDFDDMNKTMRASVMGVLFMIIIAMLAEAVRYLREGFESSAHLVIARNKIDVNTNEVKPAVECDPNDEDCLRVVEEVVVPLKPKLFHWRHVLNTLLYGFQCALQLQCLIGVLSLNAPLMVAAMFGVLLGRLCFFWRPRQNPHVPPSKRQ